MMNLDDIVNDYIQVHRDGARDEMEEFARLPSLRSAIRHAALCHWLPGNKRHPHQRRIPAALLQLAERTLQRAAHRLTKSRNFEDLRREVGRTIGMKGIADLTIYDITHRIGAYLGKDPRVVYLHRGTAEGAQHLGFRGSTLDPELLPAAFSKLTPAEIEDCLCIYKSDLAMAGTGKLRRLGGARPARPIGCVSVQRRGCN